MEEVFPVGNTHLPYYEDVMDHFEERGFEPEDSHVLVVGGELVAWHLKDRYPGAQVESIDVEERTMELQRNFAERLESGEDPERLVEELNDGEVLGYDEDIGSVYPGILPEIGNQVAEPDASRVRDIENYRGEPDLILSNNVCDYAFDFMDTVNRADPDFLELYTVLPAEDTMQGYDGDLEPEVNPDVNFWWVPEEMGGETDVVLYSPSN
jgi:hypothetical protein